MGLVFTIFPLTEGLVMVVTLLLSGFFLYGPHVFFVTTFPSRYHSQGVVAASTGLIDAMGYVGAALIGILVPLILDHTSGDWSYVFHLWAAISFVIVGLVIVVYFKSFKTRNTQRALPYGT